MNTAKKEKKPHIPVLLSEVLDNLPVVEGSFAGLDGTFGRGGHTKEILKKYLNGFMLGLDQDDAAITYGNDNFSELMQAKKLFLKKANFVDSKQIFDELKGELEIDGFNLIFLDLGVSSPQLDEADRGFSFYHEGPLDMRMDQTKELTAAEIVNEWSEQDLMEIFQELGEIRRPQRVVKAIINDRREEPFKNTVQLSEMIARIEGWRRKGFHPATQYFMALRLQVNHELEVVEKVIPDLIDMLAPMGRLMIITFHSLEDRIVKYAFKENLEKGRLVNKKVIKPEWKEQKSNSRARSAKMRIFEKAAASEN